MPRASVIISTYNRSTVLPYSVGSALRQTVEDLEVLVVGDCCTDDSEEVVASIDDPRLKWHNLPERWGHQSGPNNEGIKLARSPVVFYLGHDDLWFPNHVELLLRAIDAGADYAYGMTARVNVDGSVDVYPAPAPFNRGTTAPPTACAHKKALVDKAGGWGDYRKTGRIPEYELRERFLDAGARVSPVVRVTALKFTAAHRPNVYKTRDASEQKAWFERITEEPDLPQELLAGMFQDYVLEHGPRPFRAEVIRFARMFSARVKKRFAPEKDSAVAVARDKERKGAA